MADGPEAAGVAHINKHGKDHFAGALQCSWTETKGRILHATRSYQPGEVILVEPPLHIVKEEPKSAAFKKLKLLCKTYEDDFDYEPLWYWCAIQSLTKDEVAGAKAEGCVGTSAEIQKNLLLLHHEDVQEPGKAAVILKEQLCPNADAFIIERLIQIWVLNCFEYSDNPQGYSTYFFSSFMSHSCFPNAVWHYSGADHVLRSRREIKVGDEVCISYLPESGLLQSTPARRMELNETKRFWCDCERCAPGVDDLSRGMLCPKCNEGTVFAKTPVAGPANDGSLLASQLSAAVCNKCGHELSKTEASKLASFEKKLQDIIDQYSNAVPGVAIKKLQSDQAFVDAHFKQHVLADLAWEQFCSVYAAKQMLAEQRHLLERRCDFHKLAYPGLSGARAWALEALGDCMRGPGSEGRKGNGKKKTVKSNDIEVARKHYEEALEILIPMFGEDHEYVTDVRTKEVDLSD